MFKTTLIGAVMGLAPVVALAADLPAPGPAPAPIMMAPFNQWAGFYGGIGFGWNWGGSSSSLALTQAGAGQAGFVGDVYRGPGFLAAQERYNAQDSVCLTGCAETGPVFALPVVPFDSRVDRNGGAVFTLNAGYNWQFGSMVVGVEGDVSFMNRRFSRSFSGFGAADYQFDFRNADLTINDDVVDGLYEIDAQFRSRGSLSWLTTARMRAGYAMGPVLLYATGGLAAGRANMSASGSVVETFTETTTDTFPDPDVIRPTYTVDSTTTWVAAGRNSTELGWTIGGGAEWQVRPGFSLKAEYLYYDLGGQTMIATGTTTTTKPNGTALEPLPGTTTTTSAAAPIRIRQNLDGHIFRVGMNFGFPVPPRPVAPVVAAY